MAIGAVEGVVTDLLATSPNQEAFAERLRAVREDVVETVLGILR